MNTTPALLLLLLPATAAAQTPSHDARVDSVAQAVRPGRLEADLRTLTGFGTRNTFSDTLSSRRGIGAARRWVKATFDSISAACGACLQVRYQSRLVRADSGNRLPRDVMIVNVLASLRGGTSPDSRVLMTAHLDSRASNGLDSISDAPGANDDGSGVAAVLEAARVLSGRRFGKTIVFGVLSGEEQGLFGGTQLAQLAQDSGWTIEAVLNNDVVGNRAGMLGRPNRDTVRVFSQARPVADDDRTRGRLRSYGGEVDGPSRELARYVARIADSYVPGFHALLIYRLDRFGRGGDHRPFNDRGFPAVRLTEQHENYTRQHQDVRVSGDTAYGDVLEGVSFPYLARVTALDAATLASLAWAPRPPERVMLSGAVRPSTTVRWTAADDSAHRTRVYWRPTSAPQWTHWRDVAAPADSVTLEGVAIDDFVFGVASVGPRGDESVVRFPW